MKQHPLYYILAALGGVLMCAALLDFISVAWRDASFWQAAALGLLAIIGGLSLDLFRRVCRFYPPLCCFGRSGKSNNQPQH